MTLGFPNPSRSFDGVRKAVRFVGHDGVFEVRFAIVASALAEQTQEALNEDSSETECLKAFDAARNSIQDVAREAYSNSRHSSYVLTAVDFR